MWNIGEHRYPQLAKVWSIEDKGKYASVKLGTWRKDKKDDSYKNSNWSFVRFVGNAYENIDELKEGDIIEIKSGGISVEEYQDSSGARAWPKFPNIVVFAWAKSERDGGSSQDSGYVESDNGEPDDYPF